ncbi:MAG: putative multidrug ABC transporter ATP-binding protein YbhF [Candidatus Omnitrophica bacterium]|nr:putative multidrug ABC transporter ATP-binding protein YbhF [Candidatus Omnitrophota bacterium]
MSTDPALLVRVTGLSKTYGSTVALSGLDLTLQRGRILGLLGPNGAGKTTAIHILMGLLTPGSGQVRVLGMDPGRERHRIAERMNFASAYVQLPSNLKVYENLNVFAGLYGVRDARRKVEELLELFGVAELSGRLTGSLSSGEKTRVNLVKCLLNDPELLLLDEPTASLDPEMADHVRTTLRRIQRERGIGILYTSHNMPEVEELCDSIVFLHQGLKIAEGPPREVLARYGTRDLDELFIKIVRKEHGSAGGGS